MTNNKHYVHVHAGVDHKINDQEIPPFYNHYYPLNRQVDIKNFDCLVVSESESRENNVTFWSNSHCNVVTELVLVRRTALMQVDSTSPCAALVYSGNALTTSCHEGACLTECQ